LIFPMYLLTQGRGAQFFGADFVEKIGITPTVDDVIHHVYGVGGSEVVYMRRIDQIQVGEYRTTAWRLKSVAWIMV